MSEHNDAEKTFSDLSPYAAHLVLKAMLVELGDAEKAAKVTPQPFYGYSKKGTIKSTCSTGDGVTHKAHAKCEDVMFDGNSFKQWLDRYLAGGGSGSRATVNVKALVAEYSS